MSLCTNTKKGLCMFIMEGRKTELHCVNTYIFPGKLVEDKYGIFICIDVILNILQSHQLQSYRL